VNSSASSRDASISVASSVTGSPLDRPAGGSGAHSVLSMIGLPEVDVTVLLS
jgi:hypothetical protein